MISSLDPHFSVSSSLSSLKGGETVEGKQRVQRASPMNATADNALSLIYSISIWVTTTPPPQGTEGEWTPECMEIELFSWG